MPRATTKKPKAKGPKLPEGDLANGNHDSGSATDVAVAEPPPAQPGKTV